MWTDTSDREHTRKAFGASRQHACHWQQSRESKMNPGSMQDWPLTLDRIIDHAAKWHPQVEITTACGGDRTDRTNYAALKAKAQSVSAALLGLGVTFGQNVATLAWNTQTHVEAWYATMGIGAVCHTLNPRLTPEHLASMLDQSGARILIVSADLQPLAYKIAEAAQTVRHIIVIDGDISADAPCTLTISTLTALLDALSNAADVRWGEFDERSACGLCFTSGSTGAPKGVTYTHRACFLHTLRILQADVIGLTSADAVMPVVPMFHANAWGLPFAVPAAGAKLVLPGRYLDGASLAHLIRTEYVTIAVGVPTVWLGLCDHLAATGQTVPSLKRILVGGAPMPPALMDRIENDLGVTVQTSWGMTELSPVGTIGVLSDGDRRPEISGRPALGVDLLLKDQDGIPLDQQRDREGRLFVRGSAVIERYYGQETSATDKDGWFDTGDLAKLDDKSNLIITGRAKDLIKSGGEWINPAEIESIVSALPEVALAAVIGRADEKWSERPLLLVELRDGQEVTDNHLLDALKGRVASWWVPDEVIRLDAMPLAATGKIDKLKLRREHAGH